MPAPSSASRQIDAHLRGLTDWRGTTLARVRALILAANKEIVEEVKWRGVPVWSHHGIICTGEHYATVVKLTFAYGASLPDPKGLFNASLTGGTRRAIDMHENDRINARALTALVKAAIRRNIEATTAPVREAKRTPIKRLAGGNPQIAKADGAAP
ncbi:MAG: DUF1801 domain-containing protein, partial [Gemmatimonadaceae bacterium]|nr:DUF1801 domain-containing protein [Gemmatimonadaceae bacterium]